jgi:sugar lactone lactonase YvrE
MKISASLPLLAALALTGFSTTTIHAQNIFVSNEGNLGSSQAGYPGSGTVSVFDPGGNLVGAPLTAGVSDPQGLAFDSSGNLYVANYYGTTVSEYNSSGTLVNAAFASTGIGSEGLAFDSRGNLYVANITGTVSEFNSSGTLVNPTFISRPNGPPFFAIIHGLTFDSSGNLYVAYMHGPIAKFDSNGNLINASFATSSEPFDLAFDKSGNLYVSNFHSGIGYGSVSEFDANGNLINASFVSGLDGATGVAFDSSGNLFVLNYWYNTAISEFDSSGHLINIISDPNLVLPTFIAIQPVPEPYTWALLTVGIVAFLGLRRCPGPFNVPHGRR